MAKDQKTGHNQEKNTTSEKKKVRHNPFKHLKSIKTMNLVSAFRLGKYKSSVIFVVGIIAVIAVNIVMMQVSIRYDLSQNKAYTLSNATKNIVSNLEDNVTITLYVSEELPPVVKPLAQDVQDILREFQQAGNGKISIETKDPKKDDEVAQKARELGIPELQFSSMEQDSFNVQTGYFGIVISKGEENEIIPQVDDFGNLEYDITSAIYKMARTDQPRIATMGGFAGFNPQQNIPSPSQVLGQILQREYMVEDIDISTRSAQLSSTPETGDEAGSSAKIDPEFKTVIVFARGDKQYDDQELSGLREYIENNGNVVFFASGVNVNEQFMFAERADHRLYPLLKEYGLELNEDLMMSANSEVVNFGGSGGFNIMLPYPLWVTTREFNKDISFFSNVTQLTFPWSSSINLEDRNGITTTELVRTSDRSWKQEGSFVIDPQTVLNTNPTDLTQFVIAGMSELESGGKVVLIPSSKFLQFTAESSDNIDFVLNVISDLASDGALSGIRQRVVNFYPLPAMSDSEQDTFRYLNMLLLPGLFLAGGLLYVYRRK